MITIYERDAADFSGNGLGTLRPTSCIVTETMNGSYEVTLTHPIDEAGKFRRIQEERIIRVPVPAGKTPRMSIGAAQSAAMIYRVQTGSGERLHLRNGASLEAKIIGAYRVGTEVAVIDNTTHSQWSEVTTPDGKHGWMWTEYLVYVRTEASGEAAEAGIKEAVTLRDQPFRIYKIVPTLTGITAYARHIFYDLMDNMVSAYTPAAGATGAAAFQGLSDATEDAHGFTFYSDVQSTAEEFEITDKNPAEAILDDEGIIESYGGELMRDWWDVYLAERIGEETNIQIREGKNLLGISYEVDITNVVTRVIPKGEDEDGNPLYLEGRYRENEAEDKPVYANHKYGILEVKEAKIKTKGDDKRTEAECTALMEQAAKEAFEAGCDLPDVTLKVDFIDCAETEEYRQYKFLQGICMGDTVKVIARRVGVEVAMRMTQYSYDCLTKKYTRMTLGTIDATIEGNMINPRSIGSGTIKGGMIKLGSIGTGALMDGAVNGMKIALAAIGYAHIGQAAIDTLAVNAVTAVRAEIRELVAGEITTDQLYADLAVIAAAQITAANIEKANIQWAEIETLTAEIAKIANAEIGNAVIDTAQIQDLSAAVATIVKAEIALAKIDWAQIENVEIGTAQIQLGAITQALIAQGAIGTAQIADGSITAAKIVSLNADVITAGTLSAERLLIKGAGGLFYEINATAGGLTAAQLTEEQYKNAISGTALVAKSVTAEQIASKTITANEILGGTITAAEIDVANLFAAEATIAALDSYIIRTTTIEALQGRLDVWASEKVRIGVDSLQIGGRNLLRFSKELPTGSTTDEWGLSDAEKASTYDDAGSGFDRIMLTDSGQTEDTWVYARSPLMRLPGGWQGKQVTLSAYIWSSDWAGMDAGGQGPITWSICLSKGTAERLNYGSKYNLIKPGEAALGADAKGDTLANGKWVRINTTFTLNEEELSGGTGVFGDNTHIFVQFFLRRNGEYRIDAPKLEIGNKATDWSPAPEDAEAALTIERDRITAEVKRATEAEGALSGRIDTTAEGILLEVNKKANAGDPATGVNTGEESSVRVTITADDFDVDVPGEDGDLTLNESGGRLPVLIGDDITAPNVAPRYDGAGGLYVDPNATSAQIAAGNYFRSLKDALATLDRKWVGKNIVINLAAGMTEYGTLSLVGVSGGCWITIQGDSGSPATLNGRLNLYFCSSPISVKYLNIDTPTTGINAEGCQAVSIANAVINGPGTAVSGSRGVRSAQGSMVTVTSCEIYECERALYGDGAPIVARSCKGNCRVGAFMTTLYLAGSMPCDSTTWTAATWAGQVITQDVTVDMGSATVPSTEPVTAAFDYLYSDSYARGWNAFADEDARQGYNGETIHGVIWFDAAGIQSALSGRTIHQASLRLHMQTGVGRGVNVSVQLYGSDVSYERTSAPGLTTSYGTIGSTVPGEINEITIPVQAITDIVNGTIQALVLKSDDTGYYNNRGYSKNYARFSGSTSATADNCPRLTVVYQ